MGPSAGARGLGAQLGDGLERKGVLNATRRGGLKEEGGALRGAPRFKIWKGMGAGRRTLPPAHPGWECLRVLGGTRSSEPPPQHSSLR